MSIKMAMQIQSLQKDRKADRERLDKLEEEVKLLRKECRARQQAPVSNMGVEIPPTPLPSTLAKLEIGKQPRGS